MDSPRATALHPAGQHAAQQDSGVPLTYAPRCTLFYYRDDGQALPMAVERAALTLGITCRPVSLTQFSAESDNADILWCAVGDADGPAVGALLNGRDATARQALVIEASGPAIDTIWAGFGDTDGVTLLVDPDANDCLAALGFALRSVRGAARVQSESPDWRDLQLERLQEEVQRVARVLSRLTESISEIESGTSESAAPRLAPPASPFIDDHVRAPGRSYAFADDSSLPPIGAREVRQMIRKRRLRDEFFDADIFADPAWDMLLDLYAARIERQPVAVSSLCIAAAVPATTALRWIKTLTHAGVFQRSADPLDGRRIFVELSPASISAMHRYFRAMEEVTVI